MSIKLSNKKAAFIGAFDVVSEDWNDFDKIENPFKATESVAAIRNPVSNFVRLDDEVVIATYKEIKEFKLKQVPSKHVKNSSGFREYIPTEIKFSGKVKLYPRIVGTYTRANGNQAAPTQAKVPDEFFSDLAGVFENDIFAAASYYQLEFDAASLALTAPGDSITWEKELVDEKGIDLLNFIEVDAEFIQ